MPNDTVKLKLDGEVSLRDFHTATQSLLTLLEEFTNEASPESKVDWVVTGLEDGSALIECTGVSESDEELEVKEFVLVAYDGLASDMMSGSIEDYSPRIQESAYNLSSVINGRIPRILMSTRDEEPKAISTRLQNVEPPVAVQQELQIRKFLRTTVKGEVVLASKDKRHYFTLQQSYTGDRLRCYSSKPELWHIAYDSLGKANQIVLVEGLLNTERKVISQISAIEPLPESAPGGWRLAIGAAPAPRDSISSRDAVRKVRDGEE